MRWRWRRRIEVRLTPRFVAAVEKHTLPLAPLCVSQSSIIRPFASMTWKPVSRARLQAAATRSGSRSSHIISLIYLSLLDRSPVIRCGLHRRLRVIRDGQTLAMIHLVFVYHNSTGFVPMSLSFFLTEWQRFVVVRYHIEKNLHCRYGPPFRECEFTDFR